MGACLMGTAQLSPVDGLSPYSDTGPESSRAGGCFPDRSVLRSFATLADARVAQDDIVFWSLSSEKETGSRRQRTVVTSHLSPLTLFGGARPPRSSENRAQRADEAREHVLSPERVVRRHDRFGAFQAVAARQPALRVDDPDEPRAGTQQVRDLAQHFTGPIAG